MAPSRPGNDKFRVGAFAAHVHGESLESPRRRAGHHVAAEVVGAVVTRAPQLRRVALELHGAIQVRADRTERTHLAICRTDDDAGTIAELEHLAGVRLQL